MKKILYSGAEAHLYLEKDRLVKERISKGYRHEFIDNAKRKYPTRKEFKILLKGKKIGMDVPEVFEVDDKEMKVVMEFVKGDLLKETLDNYSKKKREEVCKKIGIQVAKMHDNQIIHGDLTTSNMILKEEKVFFIDFGLGFISHKIEDKAVDLHLLRQAMESKHFKYENNFELVLKGYKKSSNFKETLERLEKVEQRGRYKRKA
ncbi:Kae1-associated serine/threonine protein kinase [Candidatus Woesearchaeota archaeon]|jgi:TP53 regulating kinase and related kinases|nr:Kae1-associated serine/threonine protein kinase [Candidatus Woesearchaeota archaeon]MBT4321831.1 Kae1-associated serine/threonine protein kinase [Candidatus Woesearchaeota archaeon]